MDRFGLSEREEAGLAKINGILKRITFRAGLSVWSPSLFSLAMGYAIHIKLAFIVPNALNPKDIGPVMSTMALADKLHPSPEAAKEAYRARKRLDAEGLRHRAERIEKWLAENS